MTFPNPIYTPLGPAARTKTDSGNITSNDAVYTFTDEAIGTAEPDRYVAVAVTMEDDGVSASATAVTIQGIAATEVVGISHAALSESTYAGIWIAKVPTGTTATIVVNGNTTMTGCAISLYRLTGIASPTATDTDTDSGTKSLFSMDLDVQSRGVAIGVAKSRDQATAATWSGLTEDDDFQSDNTRHTAASGVFAANAAASAITVTMGSERGCSACAHWATA